ncbi:hypothetical protein DPMN_191054 [Dreissena polymorpha]|uniref:Uncharacterized protein n=1 Tax=Dreissena polymorpha TaxID=45954 RepID=A0A9D4BE83_DREPO|nr:hypothetical protein DPMN_191054 [Dreissena polymorpha]
MSSLPVIPSWTVNQLPPSVLVLGEYLKLPPCLAHLLSICIQVPVPGVSRPPSLPFSLGVPCERLPRRSECTLAKGVAYPSPTSLKDVFFNWLLLCSSLLFFIGDIVLPADLEDLTEAGVDEDLYVLYGGDSGSPSLCSIEG